MSITQYRSYFVQQQQRALEAYSRLPAAVKVDHYRHTVYTAWLMCYETLSQRARELLWLIGYLHHTGITIDIFRRAVAEIQSYTPTFPTTLIGDSAQETLHTFLRLFLDTSNRWDGLLFTETINEIASRSLLDYDHIHQSYRIHVLVQSWISSISPWKVEMAIECARSLLAISIPSDDGLDSIKYRLLLGLHVDKVLALNANEVSVDHALPFARVYTEKGMWKRVEQLRLQIQATSKRVLGDEHPDTLGAMHSLAISYSQLGRFEEARDLQVQVLDARKQVLGDEHPDTLRTMQNLAVSYSEFGRYEEAKDLEVQVLAARKRVLGDEHPSTLRTMQNLAVRYSQLGRYEEARDLQVQVLDARKRLLGDEHPNTLSTMYNLAVRYLKLGQYEEARDLQVQVLDAQKRVLGDEHPDTLLTMHSLAVSYSQLSRFKESRDLMAQLLDAQKRVLGDEHPDTLSTMHNLSDTCGKLKTQEGSEDQHLASSDLAQVPGENNSRIKLAERQFRDIPGHRNERTAGSSWTARIFRRKPF